MKHKHRRSPTRSKLTVRRQVCNLIPTYLLREVTRELGAERLARSFAHWSHVVALLYTQLVHAIGLNDVGDALRLHAGPLSAIRGAPPISANLFVGPICCPVGCVCAALLLTSGQSRSNSGLLLEVVVPARLLE